MIIGVRAKASIATVASLALHFDSPGSVKAWQQDVQLRCCFRLAAQQVDRLKVSQVVQAAAEKMMSLLPEERFPSSTFNV